MAGWLEDIPAAYALLPAVVEPGTVETNPEAAAARRTEAPAPARLDVLDLLDGRRGWQDGRPCDNRRGVLGVLESWGRLVREERGVAAPANAASVDGEAAFLRRHLLWCCEQMWVDELHESLRMLHRDLADAVGEYRPRPVGRCPQDVERGGDMVTCDGPLLQSRWGDGVFCGACHDTWGYDHLRRLGLLLGEAAS